MYSPGQQSATIPSDGTREPSEKNERITPGLYNPGVMRSFFSEGSRVPSEGIVADCCPGEYIPAPPSVQMAANDQPGAGSTTQPRGPSLAPSRARIS